MANENESTKVPLLKSMSSIALNGWAGGLLGTGIVAIAVALSFGVLPRLMMVKPIDTVPFLVILVAGIVLAVAGGILFKPALGAMEKGTEAKPIPSETLYGRHLVGIGFALLVDALVCSVIIAALAWSTGRGRTGEVITDATPSPLQGDSFDTDEVEPALESSEALLERFSSLFGTTSSEALFIGGLFLLSTLAALLGALFFFANSMWTKQREADQEPFDRSLFWAGLWFRIGEAVLFNFVIFLVLRYYAPDRYVILPLVAVFIGMFLKAGEKLISGLANRVFAAFTELVPTTLKPAVVLKVLTLKPEGMPKDTDKLEKAIKRLTGAIENLKGVTRVVPDAGAGILQIEYDPNRVGVDQIRREVQLLGYKS